MIAKADLKYSALAVLLMAFIVLLFNSGMRFSLGLLLVPMADSLGWSRTTLSSMATVFMLVTAGALPFTGKLVDRLGAYPVLAVGVITSGVAIVLTSQIDQPWQAYVCYGVLFALGSACTSITPIGVILSRVYPARAGLANSVAISGMGVGQLLIISILAAFLVETSWRSAFMGLGLISMVAVLPLLYWVYRLQRRVTTSAMTGTGTVVTGIDAHLPAPQSTMRLREAMKLKSLWIILLLYAICGFQDFFIATHIVALAIDAKVESESAGQMLAFMGLAGLGGVLIAGILADRYGPQSVTLLCFIIRIVLFVVLLVSQDQRLIIAAALLYGATFWMTAPLTVIFARRIVGIGLLGTVTGLITMVHHGMGGVGAAYGAIGFDQVGSYLSGLVTMLVLSLLAAVVTWRYRAIGKG